MNAELTSTSGNLHIWHSIGNCYTMWWTANKLLIAAYTRLIWSHSSCSCLLKADFMIVHFFAWNALALFADLLEVIWLNCTLENDCKQQHSLFMSTRFAY